MYILTTHVGDKCYTKLYPTVNDAITLDFCIEAAKRIIPPRPWNAAKSFEKIPLTIIKTGVSVLESHIEYVSIPVPKQPLTKSIVWDRAAVIIYAAIAPQKDRETSDAVHNLARRILDKTFDGACENNQDLMIELAETYIEKISKLLKAMEA